MQAKVKVSMQFKWNQFRNLLMSLYEVTFSQKLIFCPHRDAHKVSNYRKIITC